MYVFLNTHTHIYLYLLMYNSCKVEKAPYRIISENNLNYIPVYTYFHLRLAEV